jgi:radical SAM protein with 4Fe4S-binding SPASM domain
MLLYAHSQEYAVCVYTTLRGLSLNDIQRIRHIPYDEFCVHTPDADGILKLTVDKPYLGKIRLLKNCNIANLSFMTLGRNRMEIAEAAGQKVNAFPICRRGDSLNIEKLPRQLWFISRDCNSSKSVFCDRQLFSCNKKIPLPHLETMVMLPDGRVLLCCMDYGMKHVLGNLFEQTYEEILNGSATKQVEDAMNNEIPGFLLCRSCELAHNYSSLSFLIFRLTGIYKDSLIRSIIRLPWFLIKNTVLWPKQRQFPRNRPHSAMLGYAGVWLRWRGN